jgi:hypothetical protein
MRGFGRGVHPQPTSKPMNEATIASFAFVEVQQQQTNKKKHRKQKQHRK